MFKRDNRIVRRQAMKTPEDLLHCFVGVQITIQQNTSNLYSLQSSIRRHGYKIPALYKWKAKRDAVLYFDKHKFWYHSKISSIIGSKKKEIPNNLMELLLTIPNLGLAKAGFFGQLISGHKRLACFDSQNIGMYGLKQSDVSLSKKLKSIALKKEKIESYLSLVDKHGGSENIWNKWCEHIYQKNPDSFRSGSDVSLAHQIWFTRNVEVVL